MKLLPSMFKVENGWMHLDSQFTKEVSISGQMKHYTLT